MCAAYLEVSAKTGAQMNQLLDLIMKYSLQLERYSLMSIHFTIYPLFIHFPSHSLLTFPFISRIHEAEADKEESRSPNLRRYRNSSRASTSFKGDQFPFRRLAILSSPLPDGSPFSFDAAKIVTMTSLHLSSEVTKSQSGPSQRDSFFSDMMDMDLLQTVDDPSLSSRSQSLGIYSFKVLF